MHEYKELLDRLQHGEIGNDLLNSASWRLVRQVAQGIADVCKAQLITLNPLSDPCSIIRLQEKAKLYGDFAQNLATQLYDEGNRAFELAKELGIDSQFFSVGQSETDQ